MDKELINVYKQVIHLPEPIPVGEIEAGYKVLESAIIDFRKKINIKGKTKDNFELFITGCVDLKDAGIYLFAGRELKQTESGIYYVQIPTTINIYSIKKYRKQEEYNTLEVDLLANSF